MRTKEEENQPPSLRRHYPVQVLRVLSQRIRPPSGGRFSTPGTLEYRFSAGNTKIYKIGPIFSKEKNNQMQHFSLLLVISGYSHIKADNMKKIIFASLATLFLLEGYSQAGDDKNLQTRKVSGFHGIQVSGGIDLYLSSGPESVSISAATPEIRDHIITEVVNGTLRIHLEENWNTGLRNPRMKAYVSLTNLQNLGASGGSDVYIQHQLNCTDLEIGLSGGSDLKGKLNANHLVINQSGGSDVDLSGNVKSLEVDASGGSDLDGYDLITDFASLHASGGCDSHLTVNKELRIVASGGSDVSYKGTASVREIKSSGSSSVTHKD
jgi:hypothetical protein